MSKTHRFDRSTLAIKPLASRTHDLTMAAIKPLQPVAVNDAALTDVASKLVEAQQSRRAGVFMMGAHVLRAGVQNYLIDLLERGYITCLSMNGAGIIHDFELALIGATTESVNRYIKDGQFGLWKETGDLNDVINQGYADGLGLGEAVGREIENGDYAHKDVSVLAACYRLGIPATVHVGIGFDIIHEHPNCDGAATGGASYRDFLSFTGALEKLEGGVICSFGSAVTAPEVFLKALSMVRNVAHQKHDQIRKFTTLVCDIHRIPADITTEPPKDEPAYYFRPIKTMLIRTVADGGQSFYVRGNHATTIPQLWSAIAKAEQS